MRFHFIATDTCSYQFYRGLHCHAQYPGGHKRRVPALEQAHRLRFEFRVHLPAFDRLCVC